MYLIYLDESGDPGLTNSPVRHYIIGGFAVPHGDWHSFDAKLQDFRAWAKDCFGLREDQEIHAAEFLGAASFHCGVQRYHRLLIVRRLVQTLSECPELRFFGWIADKELGNPLHRTGERCLRDLKQWCREGPLGVDETFLIIHDQMPTLPTAWDEGHQEHLIGRPLPIASHRSPQVQIADLIVYLLRQSKQPNRYLRDQGAHGLIKRLNELSLGWTDV